MKKIHMTDTINHILEVEPSLLETLIDLGFSPLSNPLTLKTVGKMMTLEKAVNHIKLEKEVLVEAFLLKGVQIDE